MSTLEMVTKALNSIEERAVTSLENMKMTQREFADRLLQIEQKGSGAGMYGGHNDQPGGLTLGSKVWAEMSKNGDLLKKTDRLRLEIKAAGDVTGTGSVRTIQSGVAGAPAGMILGVQHAMPTRIVGATSAIEYSRYTGLEGAAAVQAAEGDAKAAVRPTFSLIEQTGITIAGYSKVSKQAMTDSVELQRAIDITLRRSIGSALDTLLNSGSWGGAAGLLAHATAYTSLVYTNLADAASEAVATMQEAGFNPDTVVLKPADWLAITTATASGSGEYLSGAYLAPLPELLRGLKVVLSPTVTAGKVMVADSSQLELLIVDDLMVEVGTSGDDFTKNVRTILGEMRVIPTFRAVGAVRLITPKA